MPFFMPTAGINHVVEISPAFLKQWGIQGVLLDVDNTLTRHGDPTPYPGTQAWVSSLQEAGLRVMIDANNTHERVAPFAEKYGLPFCSMALKPLPWGYRRAAKQLGVSPKKCVVIGDQIFTDIIGANLLGMKSILLSPIEEEKSFSFRVRRRLERPFRKKLSL